MGNAAGFIGHVTDPDRQPDLEGNMFPVDTEVDLTGLEVTGRLPDGLRGSFVRNGPNPLFPPIGRYHMFDGDGMLHGVRFEDGGVSYRNRWVRSRGLQAEVDLGRAVYPGLADVMSFPDESLVGDAGPVKNPANTHVIRHAGHYLALWEGGLPTEITLDLETVGEYDFDGRLRGAMTAHPRIDPRTGEMFFFAYSVFEPVIRYYVVDARGALVHRAKLEIPSPVMMHDFVITEQHAVFLDSPIVLDVDKLDEGSMASWRPENGTRIGVMPRLGAADDVRWFEIDPGHVQHFWNGWAEGDRIEFSGTRFERPDFGLDVSGAGESPDRNVPPYPARFWVDLASGTAGWEQTDDLGGDFARFNDDLNGVRSRYHYMSAVVAPGRRLGDFDSIVRYDDATGGRQVWTAGPTGHVGESVFAPDPRGRAEDEGWLINAVHDSATDRTDVCVLDAADVAAGPIARVHLPRRMPFGFHANWFAAD
ncbi:MAG: carotenoid oxygenase family protein [Acidimicrobiales bacterium]|nr:carotenoid oxygenase family protein [Acidimicrobiales bacterium]